MANTLTTMQGRLFADGAVRALNAMLFPLVAIANSFDPKPGQQGDTVRVPLFPTVSSSSFAGDYSGADKTIVGYDVTIDQHLFASVHFTDREIAESPADYFTNMGAQCGKGVAKGVMQNILAVITAANYGNAAGDKLVQAASLFTVNSVATVRGKTVAKFMDPEETALVVDSTYYTQLLQDTTLLANTYGGAEAIREGKIPKVHGLKVYESTIVPTNSENLVGFACKPDAIAVAIRPLLPQSKVAVIDAGIVTDDESGIALGVRMIPEPLAGKVHYAVECLFGKAKVNGSALVRLLSA